MGRLVVYHKPRHGVAASGIGILLGLFFAWVYASMQMRGIYGGDAGDFVTSAYLWGIPHPPGYPLYTFLNALIIHGLPIGTVAWRACFLSSIPSSVAVFFLWRICFRLTKSIPSALFAVVLYATSAPVWLNAITQEVFGLYSFFAVVFLDRVLLWMDERSINDLLFLAFWAGFGATHHYAIAVSFLATLIFLLWRRRDLLQQIVLNFWKLFFLFFLGLFPLLYLPISSSFGTIMDFEGASTIQGFFRLIFRTSYGVIQATAGTPPAMIHRLLDVFTFFQFILRDFLFFGVITVLFGLIALRQRHRDFYEYLILHFLLWIVFFLAAGFPQLLNYHIGTLERFFVVPYQLVAIISASGMAFLFSRLFSRLVAVIVVLFAFLILFVSRWELFRSFRVLKNDCSMETLAQDVAKSAPQRSILFLFEDTTTFAFEHAYFVEKLRPDLKFVFFRWLGQPQYRKRLKVQYPDLIVPDADTADIYPEVLNTFVLANATKFPIASDTESDWFSGTWISNGLLFLYVPTGSAPPLPGDVVKRTKALWDTFHPPTYLLTYHKHLPMLSDVLRVYSQHRAMVVRDMAFAGASAPELSSELLHAFAFEPNVVPEAYLYPVVILYEGNRCGDAKNLLSLFVKKWGYDRVILRQYYKWSLACGRDSDVDPLSAFYIKHFPKDIQ